MKLLRIHPAIAEGNLFEAGDFEALVMFDGADKLGSFEQGFLGTSIEPRVATTENFDVKVSALKIGAVDAGDFKFATSRGSDLNGTNLRCFRVNFFGWFFVAGAMRYFCHLVARAIEKLVGLWSSFHGSGFSPEWPVGDLILGD